MVDFSSVLVLGSWYFITLVLCRWNMPVNSWFDDGLHILSRHSRPDGFALKVTGRLCRATSTKAGATI